MKNVMLAALVAAGLTDALNRIAAESGLTAAEAPAPVLVAERKGERQAPQRSTAERLRERNQDGGNSGWVAPSGQGQFRDNSGSGSHVVGDRLYFQDGSSCPVISGRATC